MKSTGIVRRLDELGRITLPIELRRTLNISERDAVEISVEEGKIILQRYDAKDSLDKNLTALSSTLSTSNLDGDKIDEAEALISKLRSLLN